MHTYHRIAVEAMDEEDAKGRALQFAENQAWSDWHSLPDGDRLDGVSVVTNYKANIAKFGYKDWYDWNCANYGSKWSDYEGVIDTYEAGLLEVVFMSAWSPIIQGMVHVSREFPKLNFLLTYNEGGMAFLGGVAIKAGELLNSIEGEYPNMDSEDDDYDAQYEKITDELDEITKVLVQAF